RGILLKHKILLLLAVVAGMSLFSEEADIVEENKTMKSIPELQKLERKAYHKELKKIMINSRRNGSLFKDAIGRYYTNGRYKFQLDSDYNDPKFSHVEYRFEDGTYETYTYPLALTEQKRYRLIYRAVDKLGNKEDEHIYDIIVDKTPPTISYSLEGLFHENDGRTYYKPGVKLLLSAHDSNSGIYTILTSIKDRTRRSGEQKFTHLGYLPYTENQKEFTKHGQESVLVRAMDKVYNLSRKKELLFFIDARGPKFVTARVSPETREIDGKAYCKKNSIVYLSAEDDDSGVYGMQYRLSDNEAWKDYRGKITLREQREVNLQYRASDNLGNMSTTKTMQCLMDITPPDSTIKSMEKP
ncbi:MAG: hypothetical protein AAF518_22970, partial [Spirochaetota bacterium]